jgi:lysozyme family protein
MADFAKAYKRLEPNEGGYSNHPVDRGGETWKGVARNYHPTWLGWALIDGYKLNADFPGILYHSSELEALVQDFYKKNFWAVCRLDKVSSQWLADNIFDAAVNCGTYAGAVFLQRAVNHVLDNRLEVDGRIGPLTINAAGVIDEEVLVNRYIDIRLNYHREIAKRNPSQKVFLLGWEKRCERMRKKVS